MKQIKNESGQALITLLIFVLVAITIISASAIILYVNGSSISDSEKGIYSYYLADSGIEDGTLKLLRNPSYSGTYAVNAANGTISVTISSGIITSTGTYLSNSRKIEAQTSYSNGKLSITSWKEIN